MESLSLALGQPTSLLGDLAFNVGEHARLIRDVAAQVIVFPELSLTGYGMDQQPVDPSDRALEPLVEACATSMSIALAGAPTLQSGERRRRISMLRVDNQGISVVYSKMHLGGDEPNHFAPGDSPAVLDVHGWRLGLAICKDNGHDEHAAEVVRLGIDAYVAGVCETENDRTIQAARAQRIVNAHQVWVAYASFAGSTGGGFVDTAGRSAVWDPNGIARLQLGKSPGQASLTTLTR